MKTSKKILLFLASVALLGGCTKNETSSTQTSTPNSDNDDYGIMDLPLGMKLSVIDIDGLYNLTLEIDNQSGYEMTYTEDFQLQVLEDEEWSDIPVKDGAVIIDSVHTIADLEQQTIQYNLEDVYGELQSGTYRLIQDDMVSNEFTIQ